MAKTALSDFDNMPSAVNSQMYLYFKPAAWSVHGLEWPSNPKVEVQIKTVMDQVVEALLHNNVHILSTVVGLLPVVGGEEDPLARQAVLTVQGNLLDTGSVMQKVQNDAPAIEQSIQNAFAAAHMTWGNYVTISFYADLNYAIAQTGEKLRQRTGRKWGSATSSDGTPAVKVTSR